NGAWTKSVSQFHDRLCRWIEGRPLRQALAIRISRADEIHPVAGHLICNVPVRLCPRTIRVRQTGEDVGYLRCVESAVFAAIRSGLAVRPVIGVYGRLRSLRTIDRPQIGRDQIVITSTRDLRFTGIRIQLEERAGLRA